MDDPLNHRLPMDGDERFRKSIPLFLKTAPHPRHGDENIKPI